MMGPPLNEHSGAELVMLCATAVDFFPKLVNNRNNNLAGSPLEMGAQSSSNHHTKSLALMVGKCTINFIYARPNVGESAMAVGETIKVTSTSGGILDLSIFLVDSMLNLGLLRRSWG